MKKSDVDAVAALSERRCTPKHKTGGQRPPLQRDFFIRPFRRDSCLTVLCDIRANMVATRFSDPEQRATGFLLLARVGTVRTLRGEIYVCSGKAPEVLDSNKISYIRVPPPVNQNEVDALKG